MQRKINDGQIYWTIDLNKKVKLLEVIQGAGLAVVLFIGMYAAALI